MKFFTYLTGVNADFGVDCYLLYSVFLTFILFYLFHRQSPSIIKHSRFGSFEAATAYFVFS